MKKLLVAVCLLQIMVSGALAASPKEEERIVAQVTAAFKNRDATALHDLYCLEGTTKEQRRKTLKADMLFVGSGQVEKVSIVEANEKDRKGFTHNGVKYVPNLKVIGTVQIKMVPTKSREDTLYFPLGEKRGKLYLVLPRRAK